MNPLIICPLCKSTKNKLLYKDQVREYLNCNTCELIFVPTQFHLSESEEKLRYDTHNNDSKDPRYRQFLSQLSEPLMSLIPDSSVGLDFGCGPGPTLSLMLEEKGYQVNLYDKFYYQDKSVFDKTFDFITLTEVIEHLSDPIFEIGRLKSILKPNGVIAIMTQTLSQETDFKTWYYKNDPSHLGFYNQKSLDYLAKYFELEISHYSERVIFLKKIF
tara:strand:+ start:767 stop:1414 length:648 start_codon:yes stop_codon:yes gene_type:complete